MHAAWQSRPRGAPMVSPVRLWRRLRAKLEPQASQAGGEWLVAPIDTVMASVDGAPAGLSSAAAQARLAHYGLNRLPESDAHSPLAQLLRRFLNPMVLVLVVASAISAFTGDVASLAIIMAMVLLSVILDFAQEYRAGAAAHRLRQSVQIHATVVRDGATREVPTTQVVPGDIVLLDAGSLFPADGRVLAARDMFVNQALLPGEPFPVEKKAEAPADRQLD